MICKQVQAALIEDLTHRAEAQTAAHLRSCASCRALCDELLELEELSRSLSGRFRVPPTFQHEVLSRAAVQTAPTRRYLRRVALVAIAAGALLVAFMEPWDSADAEVMPEPGEVSAEVWTLDKEPASGQPPYVEVVISNRGDEEFILRLPRVIEIHRTDLREDFYINNVSH